MSGQPSAKKLPGRIVALRKVLGLSQEQLANRLEVSFATVNRWEAGRTSPHESNMRAIEALEIGIVVADPVICQLKEMSALLTQQHDMLDEINYNLKELVEMLTKGE